MCFAFIYAGGQPTTFTGPAMTKSEMHEDLYLQPFWLNVYLGAKSFRVIRYEDALEHMEFQFGDTNNRYKRSIFNRQTGNDEDRYLEIWNPDLTTFPGAHQRFPPQPTQTPLSLSPSLPLSHSLLTHAHAELEHVRVYEGTAQAGDLVYIPTGALHGIMNPEASLCTTTNYLPPAMLRHYIDIAFKNRGRYLMRDHLANLFPECEADGLINMDAGVWKGNPPPPLPSFHIPSHPFTSCPLVFYSWIRPAAPHAMPLASLPFLPFQLYPNAFQ